jgi:hypothetical protein
MILNQKKLSRVETLRIRNKNEKDKMVFGWNIERTFQKTPRCFLNLYMAHIAI